MEQTQPDSIRALLLRTLSQTPMRGERNACFDFANDYDLGNYILRVPKRLSYMPAFKSFLESTSSITPAHPLISCYNVGQPLLQIGSGDIRSGYVSILQKQRGISLNEYIGALVSEHGMEEGCALWCQEMVDIQKRTGVNPFEKIFKESKMLSRFGYPDFDSSNVFYDKKTGTLALIDQLKPRQLGDSPRFSPTYFRPQEDKLIYFAKVSGQNNPQLRDEYIALVRNAAQAAIEQPASPSLTFANVSDVKAISLDDPPRVLVEMLREMQQRAAIPAR